MKIKTKLNLGVGLLFIMIILLSVVGTSYINALKNDSENILVANYHSLEYSRNMLVALEDGSAEALQSFEENLRLQEDNDTEIGEKKATITLRNSFSVYTAESNTVDLADIRKEIFKIMDMNMQAIQYKSKVAEATAAKAVYWILISGILCFLIAFALLVNLPSNIANPIKELTESIKQIASKNYTKRVAFEGNSEFGQLAKSFNTMAEKLEEYSNSNLAKLMVEKTRIETLINNMHDPVIGLDEQQRIIFANDQAMMIVGLKKAEIIGFHSQELALNNDLIRTLIQDLSTTESDSEIKPKPIKIYANNKEGYFEKETLHISIVPTGEQIKKLIGHVIILRNITEYKEREFAKTNFIATVSHEFKTPISSIKMSLQLLENNGTGTLNQEQKALVDSIRDDTGRLLKITSELLNMAQVESGNIQLSILPADPMEMLRYAINTIQTQADQKEIRFAISCPDKVSKVQADSEKTAWILINLISNAIRYSHEHSIIYLTIEEQNRKVQISVRDTGQGIAPQFINKVFDRYFRVPGLKDEGTGLGLSISKEFIEAQGGTISVHSEYGVGSTFSITLKSLT